MTRWCVRGSHEDVVSTWAWRGLDGGLAITTKVMHDFAEALYRPGVHWPERFMKRNPELKRQTLSSPTSSLSDWCEPAARGAATGEPFIGRLNGEATVHPGIFQWTGGKLGAVEELHAWLLKNKEGQSKLLTSGWNPEYWEYCGTIRGLDTRPAEWDTLGQHPYSPGTRSPTMPSTRQPSGSRHSKLNSQNPKNQDPKKQDKGKAKVEAESELWTQSLVVYMFHGEPDIWNNRHVLVQLESAQNPHFHQTVHVLRVVDEIDNDKDKGADGKKKGSKQKMPKAEPTGERAWKIDRCDRQVDWTESKFYMGHLDSGLVYVNSRHEKQVADVLASQPVPDPGFTDQGSQIWLMGAMHKLVKSGLQTQDWYNWWEAEFLNFLMVESTDEVP
ncbi:hypothetical protein OOU_Y34scaffold00275g11 [Pyricularia oryzae Y34]|uniref:HTH CENPB-type domain-containing protein n=4 Tax=Pyricularia oryzae TaxID=318829 RepID=Q2KF62_PYRO7|nr:hypothetical protein MGCH7_ch7g824 [Pyricularia oryzae 70-15]ELQ41495.1 hypothetical protein OOU_Y34scaffold00275g11 [Pyricularia oryzae Y34]